MYATISTAQIKPQSIAAFCERWRNEIEPIINQLPALVDLYVLVNPESGRLLVLGIYASEADALACPASDAYQQLFQQSVDLLYVEIVTHAGYTIIST